MKSKTTIARQRFLPFFLIAGLLLLLSAAFYVQKRILPQQIVTIQMDLNVPVRYAFISDEKQAKIAVLDTYEQKVVNLLDSTVPAQLMAVSRLGGFLIYAQNNGKRIFQLDLTTLKKHIIPVSKPLKALSVSANGQLIIAETENQLLFIHKGNVLKQVKKQGAVSVTFSADTLRVFVAEHNSGHIRQYDTTTLADSTLLELNRVISPISLMSDNRALFFSAHHNAQIKLYRYDLSTKQLTTAEPMVAFMRPYISSDNRNVLTIGEQQGKAFLYQLDPDTLILQQQYPLGDFGKTRQADNIRTGWLEQFALVALNKALYSVALNTTNLPQRHALLGNYRAMLVSADSKTLLATLNASSSIWIYDVRTQAFAPPVTLPLQQPDNVIMGQTNTLCH